MTTEHPSTPSEQDPPSEPGPPAWKPHWASEEPRQDALPIPESTGGDAILYPSDPTTYPAPSEPAAPPPPSFAPYDAPYFLDDQPPPEPAAPARPGIGRGLLVGLLLGAVIAAAGFGIGRFTSDSSDPVIAEVPTTVTATSLVSSVQPPPVAVAPQIDGDVEPVAAAAAAVSPAVVQLDTSSGTGSGVIYDAEGYILTAAHVVGNATNVAVRFADGSSTTGTVLGADEVTDVAVVSIEPGEVPAVAVLAVGADLSVGQTAVAVGTPFGLDQTVTSGIISAVERIVDLVSMVQTDAAINPGNSGGPLVDLAGQVIGINDVIFTTSGDNAGVGFAISIDLAKIIADQITAGEPPSVALLGVTVGRAANGDAGGMIGSVSPGTAAESAGLEIGDLVISIDGDPIRDSDELRAEVITRVPGTVIELVLVRDGQQITIAITLGSVQTDSN